MNLFSRIRRRLFGEPVPHPLGDALLKSLAEDEWVLRPNDEKYHALKPLHRRRDGLSLSLTSGGAFKVDGLRVTFPFWYDWALSNRIGAIFDALLAARMEGNTAAALKAVSDTEKAK